MLALPGAVAFKCELIDRRSGEIVGEGRGVAMPKEKTSWIANTQVKICEKRAMVDAVLQTFGLSSRYTQDMEDTQNGAKPAPTRKSYVPKPSKATTRQLEFIGELLKETPVTLESLEKQIGKPIQNLTTQGATEVINQLKTLTTNRPMNPTAPDESEIREGEIVQ